jgi:hypothetical protein
MTEAVLEDHRIGISLSADDCEQSMGRKPIDADEFERWALLVEKGLFNGHIDWDMECMRDAIGSRS